MSDLAPFAGMPRPVDAGLMPLCACGAPAMAWAPGTDPESAADLFLIGRGEAVRAWCLPCWQDEFWRVRG